MLFANILPNSQSRLEKSARSFDLSDQRYHILTENLRASNLSLSPKVPKLFSFELLKSKTFTDLTLTLAGGHCEDLKP